MSRTNRTQANRNGNRAVTTSAERAIAAQLRRLSNEEVFAMTFSGDRNLRRIADMVAHERAEQFARDNG